MRNKWEYQYIAQTEDMVPLSEEGVRGIVGRFNEKGAEGWELVQSTGVSAGSTKVFIWEIWKRKIDG